MSISKIKARELVENHNQKLKDFHDAWMKKQNNPDKIDFGQWLDYNQGRDPLIREGLDLVHSLHDEGHADYRINMQSGEIS